MFNGELSIRRYEPGDLKDVFELHKKALLATGAYIDGKWNDDFNDIESVYIKTGGEFLVGTINHKIAAMGALKKLSKDTAEIKRMRVEPSLQRRGFGQKILSELETCARKLGYKTLQLDTTVKQEAAQKLYEKNGYKEFKREITAGLECIFYKKILL